MRRIAALALCAIALSGFARWGINRPEIAILAPGGGENSTTYGSKQPQAIDSTHPSMSRWADDLSLSTRTTVRGASTDAGHTMDVLMYWDSPMPMSGGPPSGTNWDWTKGNYTLNGQRGILICVHANHVSNTDQKWSGAAGSMVAAANTKISVEMSVDGGTPVTASKATKCPLNGVTGDYLFFTPIASLADGPHEFRAHGWAVTGYDAYLSSVKNISETYAAPPSGTTTQTPASVVTGGSLNGTTETLQYTRQGANAAFAVVAGKQTGTNEVLGFLPQGGYSFPFFASQLITVNGVGSTSGTWNSDNFLVASSTGACLAVVCPAPTAPVQTVTAETVVGSTVTIHYTDAGNHTFPINRAPYVTVLGSNPATLDFTNGVVASNTCSVGACVMTVTIAGVSGSFVSGGIIGNMSTVTIANSSATGTYTSGGSVSDYNSGFVKNQTVVVTGMTPSNWNTTGATVTENTCAGWGTGLCSVSFTNGSASGGFSAGGTITTNEAVFTDPGHHHQVISGATSNQLIAITGSSDANIPNYCRAPNSGCATVSTGVYCLDGAIQSHQSSNFAVGQTSINPLTYEMHQAVWTGGGVWSWSCLEPTLNLTSPGASVSGGIETVTYTDSLNLPVPPGNQMTVASVSPSTLNVTAAFVQSQSCNGSGTCTALLIAPAASGSYVSGGTIHDVLPSPNITSDGTGQNMVATELYAGSREQVNTAARDNRMAHGSLFLWTNVGSAIAAPTAWVDSVAGNNGASTLAGLASLPGNCQSSGSPCLTTDIAAASLTAFSLATFGGQAQVASNTAQSCGAGGASVSALTWTIAGNATGGYPVTVGQPIEYIANNSSGSSLLSGATLQPVQSYFVRTVTNGGQSFTLSEYPGGPCITDSSTLYASFTEFLPDFSFATINLECTNSANCPVGSPEQFYGGQQSLLHATASNFGWSNINALQNTAISLGKQQSPWFNRLHTTGNLIPQTYTATTTADLQPLAAVGPTGGSFGGANFPSLPVNTPVTGGSLSGTTVHLTYTDPANKTFQVLADIPQLINVSGISPADWNGTNLPVTAASCNGSGSCFVEYTNAGATTASWTSGGTVLIQTVALPVHIPVSAGQQTTNTPAPSGVSWLNTITVAAGATPVGPAGGFVFYCGRGTSVSANDCGTGTAGSTSANTVLIASPQDCLFYQAGEGANANAPPGTVTWVQNLDISGGFVNYIVLTSGQATTYGFLNVSDCPSGYQFIFNNSNASPVWTSLVDSWLDSGEFYSDNPYTVFVSVATATSGNYATNFYFRAAAPNSNGMTLIQNSVIEGAQVCLTLNYQAENTICRGLGPEAWDSYLSWLANPTVPEYAIAVNQLGSPLLAHATGGTLPAVPHHIGLGWLAQLSCQDAGNPWGASVVLETITGYNFANNTVSWTPALANSASAVLPPANCNSPVYAWNSGVHYDYMFTQLTSKVGNVYPATISFPGSLLNNVQSQSTLGLIIAGQGGGQNSISDLDFENSGLNMIGGYFSYAPYDTNALWINNIYPFGNAPISGGPSWVQYNEFPSNPGPTYNNNIFIIQANPLPSFQVTGVTIQSDGTTETLSYADANNVVQPVGTLFNSIGIQASGLTSPSLSSLFTVPILDGNNVAACSSGRTTCGPSCAGGTCLISFTNNYSPTSAAYVSGTGVIQFPTWNPKDYGSPGCFGNFGPSTSSLVNGASGIHVWPAANSVGGSPNNWTTTNTSTWNGITDPLNGLLPWYPSQTTGTVGTGSC